MHRPVVISCYFELLVIWNFSLVPWVSNYRESTVQTNRNDQRSLEGVSVSACERDAHACRDTVPRHLSVVNDLRRSLLPSATLSIMPPQSKFINRSFSTATIMKEFRLSLAHKKKWSVHWAPPIYGHGFRPAEYEFQVSFSRPPSNFE